MVTSSILHDRHTHAARRQNFKEETRRGERGGERQSSIAAGGKADGLARRLVGPPLAVDGEGRHRSRDRGMAGRQAGRQAWQASKQGHGADQEEDGGSIEHDSAQRVGRCSQPCLPWNIFSLVSDTATLMRRRPPDQIQPAPHRLAEPAACLTLTHSHSPRRAPSSDSTSTSTSAAARAVRPLD